MPPTRGDEKEAAEEGSGRRKARRPLILLVEDDAPLADQLRWALKDRYRVLHAADRPKALRLLEQRRPDLVLLDLCLPPENTPDEGFRVLEAARGRNGGTVVVVMSAIEERQAALNAVARGALDFFSKPVDLQSLRVVLERSLERQALERENRRLREQLRERFHVDGIIGISLPMQRVLDAIGRVKDSTITVLVQGESGTGKELVARAIHFSGSRRERPFVPVHCAALPETLLEAELFGHERGAFTGAVAERVGRFEGAEGGTVFLDEIATLSPAIQVKLLRVIEERTVERLGSNRRRRVDIRLIVATNEDLEAKVRRGEFRPDLFFRVNVFPIRIPPLRERLEDVPLLADHFLRRACREQEVSERRLAPETVQSLMSRSWPGNVRELQNAVETAALLADGDTIRAENLPLPPEAESGGLPSLERARAVGFKDAVREYEKAILEQAIARAGGVHAQAARDLHLDAGQMKHLARKHRLGG